MATTALNSPQAVRMSVFVVRAFIKMREQLLRWTELDRRLSIRGELEAVLSANAQRVIRLRQTVLKNALSGQLIVHNDNAMFALCC